MDEENTHDVVKEIIVTEVVFVKEITFQIQVTKNTGFVLDRDLQRGHKSCSRIV